MTPDLFHHRLSAQAWLFLGVGLSAAAWGINRIRRQSSSAVDGGQAADWRRHQQQASCQTSSQDWHGAPCQSPTMPIAPKV